MLHSPILFPRRLCMLARRCPVHSERCDVSLPPVCGGEVLRVVKEEDFGGEVYGGSVCRVGEERLAGDEEALDKCFFRDGEVEAILEDGGVGGGEDFEGESGGGVGGEECCERCVKSF